MSQGLGARIRTAHISAMRRLIFLALLVLVMPFSVLAEARPQGLLWAEAGVPRTLPLQVKTVAGSDYLVVLREPDTGAAVLAAYVRGGEFFRVLVPPGRFDLDFATGPEWQGDETLFGPGTRHFTLAEPLDFGVTGAARKGGQIVDLRDPQAVGVKTIGICQRLALDPESLRKPQPLARPATISTADPSRNHPARDLPPFVVPDYGVTSRICD